MDERHEQTLFKRRHTFGQKAYKKAQYHWSLEKCKSKPQWDTISHQSEWLLLKSQKITGAGAEKEEHFYTVGGSVKLVQPLWKVVWRFLKELKTECPFDPAIQSLGIYPKE